MVRKSDLGYCPECDVKINVKSPKLGQIVICRACDTRLEVIDLSPLELDWAFEDTYDDDVFDDPAFSFDEEDLVYEDKD